MTLRTKLCSRDNARSMRASQASSLKVLSSTSMAHLLFFTCSFSCLFPLHFSSLLFLICLSLRFPPSCLTYLFLFVFHIPLLPVFPCIFSFLLDLLFHARGTSTSQSNSKFQNGMIWTYGGISRIRDALRSRYTASNSSDCTRSETVKKQ
jgi:hypothetical protein